MKRKPNILFEVLLLLIFCAETYAVGISMIGCDKLIFNAGERNQSVNFRNPDSNSCYFKLSLILDGGKILWSSDFMEPRAEIKEISLAETLNAGTYKAVLKHQCFSLDDKTPLNGLDMNLTILVKEVSIK